MRDKRAFVREKRFSPSRICRQTAFGKRRPSVAGYLYIINRKTKSLFDFAALISVYIKLYIVFGKRKIA